ncbi:MAG: PKD domain-containing protein [Melioribacter sp.]|nr:PKD domain-containing protein [Melioribacter sp.]
MIVTVVDAPVALFNSSTLVPEKKPITFDASESKTSSGKIFKYEWNFGDGNSAEGKIVNHTYNKYGNYKVTLIILTDSKGECSTASASKQIIVNSRPIATASAPKNASVNQTIELFGTQSVDYDGMITNYYWDLGDGSTKEGVIINYAYSKSGKYRVILKVEDNSKAENNFDYDTTYVLINAEPKAVFNLPEQVYKNFEFILDASKSFDPDGTITSYEWFLNDQKISDEKSLKHKIDKPGIYRIRLLVKDNGQPGSSSDELTKYITVLDYPSIKLPNTSEVCIGETFTLKPAIENPANDQSIRYRWYSDSGSEVTSGKEYTGRVNKSGKHVYYLEISNNSNFIFDRDSTVVVVNTQPVIETISDKTVYIGGANDEIRLEANVKDEDGDFLSYEWNLGNGTISNRPVVIHKYKKEGEYNVLLTVRDNKNTSCSKTTAAFKVKVLKSK